MRCYHFSNMYLSSIQQGIQAAHAQMELFVKYNPLNVQSVLEDAEEHKYRDAVNMLYKWGEEHKTMICLNAGFNSEMQAIEDFLSSDDNPYPWASFYESEEAMGGLLTNIAIVLPERIYGTSEYELDHESGWAIASKQLTPYEQDLIRMKGQYRMAK